MNRHELKCWPEHFAAIVDGSKRFEVRENDRDYQLGDTLLLREWCPDSPEVRIAGTYTGRGRTVRVTHLYDGPGVAAGYVVMSVEVVA